MPKADKNATDEILKRREEVIGMPLPVFSPAGQAKYVASGVIALFTTKKKNAFFRKRGGKGCSLWSPPR